jgi:WD40 repeat protein
MRMSFLTIWDGNDRKKYSSFRAHEGRVSRVSFSGNGEILATNSSSDTILWNVSNELKVGEIRTRGGAIWVSPSGDSIAATTGIGNIGLFGVTNVERTMSLRGHANDVLSMAFSQDKNWLVSGDADGTCKLWNAVQGTEVVTLRGHVEAVTSIALSSDAQQVAAGSDDGTLRIWDVSGLIETTETHR